MKNTQTLNSSFYLPAVMHLSMTCPTPPHAGNTRGLGGVLPEIIAQTKGDLPFPNVLVEHLEGTYEVSFLSEESISD